jgi:hypothetical protein
MTATLCGPGLHRSTGARCRSVSAFYEKHLGLRRAPASPPGAVVFATEPVPFAVRELFTFVGPEGYAITMHED